MATRRSAAPMSSIGQLRLSITAALAKIVARQTHFKRHLGVAAGYGKEFYCAELRELDKASSSVELSRWNTDDDDTGKRIAPSC